ncbi:MAG: von Willebrand factor type A domain-containing protein [Kofleriaceae bacterium]
MRVRAASSLVVSLVVAASLSGCGAPRSLRSTLAQGDAPPPPPALAVDVAAPADPAGDVHADPGRNPWVDAAVDPRSTFAADVDTASFTYSRRVIEGGQLPVPAAVRTEEFVNAFAYQFPAPAPGSPFAVVMDAAPSPFVPGRHLVRVGVATPRRAASARTPMRLVFLVDVSGSMSSPDKLGLAKQALRHLVRSLGPRDTVALVTYAGSTGVVLPVTRGDEHRALEAAIDRLDAGGSTAMGSGLALAYQQAQLDLPPGTPSRVIVMSDGDANVGPASLDELMAVIDGGVRAGVTLSTIGFGMGNYRDDLMEQLGDRGNGNNFYVDSAAAAERLFTTDLVAMLEVAAKDVKLQVEFDPNQVARYRLLGYENRAIADDDFRVDRVDAGEVGVGHQVTALYEVELAAGAGAAPLGLVRIRHKAPAGDVATEQAFAMAAAPAATFAAASADLRFAAAVAMFADYLRGADATSLVELAAVAEASAGTDPDRQAFVALVKRAGSLGQPAKAIAVAR